MKKSRIIGVILIVVAAAAGAYYFAERQAHEIVLTGIVTTDEVIVSSQIQGRLQRLLVKEGDGVTHGELLAQIQPEQWQADMAFYDSSEQQSTADLAQARADMENVQLNFERMKGLYASRVESLQDYDQARTAYDSATARVESIQKQIAAAEAQKAKAKVYLDYTEICRADRWDRGYAGGVARGGGESGAGDCDVDQSG